MSTITRARACKGKRKLTRDAAHRMVARLTAAGAAPGVLERLRMPLRPNPLARETRPGPRQALRRPVTRLTRTHVLHWAPDHQMMPHVYGGWAIQEAARYDAGLVPTVAAGLPRDAAESLLEDTVRRVLRDARAVISRAAASPAAGGGGRVYDVLTEVKR